VIKFFPTPYPDELLYSVCARYAARMGYPSAATVAVQLFGSRNVVSIVDLPNRLAHIAERFSDSNQVTPDSLINLHTLLPFFAPFIPVDRLHKVRQAMKEASKGRVHSLIGMMAIRLPALKMLRFCPKCVESDRTSYGECYWHRIHQVSGVDICAHHFCLLQDSKASAQRKSTHYAYTAAEDVVGKIPLNVVIVEDLHLRYLAHQTYQLLNTTIQLNLETLIKRYRERLQTRGFLTSARSLRRHDLHAEFISFYTPELLSQLYCHPLDVKETWLSRIVRSAVEFQHPVCHLLTMRFLDIDVDVVERTAVGDLRPPFGIEPWPCLNSVCPNFLQQTIQHCQIKYSRYTEGRPIGLFTCPICGFAYSRTGPDTDEKDYFRIGKIHSFGSIWEQHLIQALNQNNSLRSISRLLGVDVKTVKRHIQRLTSVPLDDSIPAALSLDTNQEEYLNIRSRHRGIWLEARATFPSSGISELRRRANKTFTWLYRHDRDWLDSNKPGLVDRSPGNSRLDWAARDEQLSQAIDTVVEKLLSHSGSSQRLTITAIGRAMGQLALFQKHLTKLPKTRQKIALVIEDQEAWALRRVRQTVEDLKEEQSTFKLWEIVRLAGLGRLSPNWIEEHVLKYLASQGILVRMR
jgi:transposase-like protein